jgi:hypothetical protein
VRRKAELTTSFFTPAPCAQLLVGAQASGDAGYVVAVLPAPLTGPGGYEFADVLSSTQLNASIVFLRLAAPATESAQQTFVNAILALVGAKQRAILWLADPSAVPSSLGAATAVLLQGGGNSVTTSSPLSLTVGTSAGLSVTLGPSQTLTANASAMTIGGGSPPVFGGAWSPGWGHVFTAPSVPISGPERGCLQFSLYVPQSGLNWDFVFGTAGTIASPAIPQTLSAPLALGDPNQNSGFAATFDPLDQQAASNRNSLVFLGVNINGATTILRSFYGTATGAVAINLLPVIAPAQAGDVAARLVFAYPPISTAIPDYLTLQPDGDFVIATPGSSATHIELLCGLQGAEYLTVQPKSGTYAGDRLRFFCGQPAYAPTFPFPISSPVGVPFDPAASPLTASWTASWATIRPPAGAAASIVAVAQPPGFNLFGQDNAIHGAHPNLLGHADPGTLLPADPQQPFPLVPYLGVMPGADGTTFSPQQISDFETQVIGPQRHAALVQQEQGTARVLSARAKLLRRNGAVSATGTTLINVTTPSGYLVTLSETGTTTTWAKILLAKLIESNQELAFLNPDAKLEQAFQAGQLMLVVANSTHTGDFENGLDIGGWKMQADVGAGSAYGDYANVLIVKAVPGALYDPAATDPTTNLVANPSKWTMAPDFAAPATTSADGTALPPDPSQLINLSQWMQGYFKAAFDEYAVDPTYFASFCALAQDPAWTGVLVLRGKILAPPPGIAGITAGITDEALFNVHHLAVPLTPIVIAPPNPDPKAPQGPYVAKSSSVSGLIYYLDPSANAKDPSKPIPTDPTKTYAFRLLSLKVLFENSAVAAFSSYVQVTLRSFFGSAAASADPAKDDCIVLAGSYQLVDKQPIYSMASLADSPFMLTNNVLRRVEITGVQMSTVKADPTGDTESAFSMVGFLDFAVVPGTNYASADPTNPQSIDLFGFGNLPGQANPRTGLAFQALTLTMTFPTQSPATPPVFALQTAPMRFDTANSTLRPASLVKEFKLQLTSYTAGSDDPAQLGYLPVVAMIPAGELGTSWNGLAFRVDLGTPGNLASAAGLNSSLLLAWSPVSPSEDGSTWAVRVGLQLPGTAQGAPLISLQNVLKLSIGQVALAYAQTADKTRYGFLLMLNEIAMTFLGLLKIPPNGATSFYLFGDPNGADALGWYAIYNNEPAKKQAELTRA